MNIFDTQIHIAPRRNKFDLSHEVKLTGNMGPLYPILCEEVVPGDKFRVSSEVFLRFLALIAPVMHRVDVFVHFFFVPNRLLWISWEDFITGGRDGLAAPTFPTFTAQNANAFSANIFRPGSLLDYLGFPCFPTANAFNAGYNAVTISGLPCRAYALIYDTYYRDQNVTASILTANFKADGNITGADLAAILPLRVRAWEKDIYTSALPFLQRGNAVTVPITSTITAPTTGVGASAPLWRKNSDGSILASQTGMTTDVPGHPVLNPAAAAAYLDPNGSLLASSSSLTINALRLSVRLQEWLEKNATGGARFKEVIQAHFGVISSDARLQRPEYLGGGKQPVVVSEVLQTAPIAPPTGGQTPLATMGGHGLSMGVSNSFSKFFEEHGFVLGILSVVPRTSYQQFEDVMWKRFNNTDYYWPSFAHLGEQAIFNGDVYTDFSDAAAIAGRGNVFGYQSRYSEYKFAQSRVCGNFRDTLSYWHLGRQFASPGPSLNTAFIECDARTNIFAVVTDTHHVVVQVFHKIDALRPMPYFGTPRL